MLNYNANGPSGYNLTNSLRFRASASARLSRTFGSASNYKIQTFSAWVKRGNLSGSTVYRLMGGYNGSAANSTEINFLNDTLRVEFGGAANNALITTQVFRDPSAWYHIVVAIDTTQATSSNRVKIYVNGVQVTAFGTANYPSQNADSQLTSANANNSIGSGWSGFEYFDGYMTEINFIDGQALTPSSFGNTNSTTGVWQPAKYTGTYGTNGFYLPFSPNATSTYAGSFSGTGKYLTTPSSGYTQYINGSGNFTIEFWANYSSLPTGGLNQGCSWYAQDSGSAVISPFNLFQSGNTWSLYASTSGSGWDVFLNTTLATTSLTTNTWYHIACVRNGNTLTLYIDGVAVGSQSLTASLWSTNTYTTYLFGPWQSSGSTNGFQGSISNYRLVKGTAVYTANFTPPTTALTNITNTSLLTLQSATVIDNSSNAFTITNPGSVTTATATPFVANIAADASGNNNGWIPNNINVATSTATTYDAMTDVPTLTSTTTSNYAVMNPIETGDGAPAALSNGNLTVTGSASLFLRRATMTFPLSGKYYAEFNVTAVGSGVSIAYDSRGQNNATQFIQYDNGGTKNINGTTSAYGASFTTGDVVALAVDADGGNVYFYKNNVSQGAISFASASMTGVSATAMVFAYTSAIVNANFGQRPFTYTAPSGYLPLNTYNLPTSTIVQGNKYMNATLYTGTGSPITVTNAGSMQPDFLWLKNRSLGTGGNHVVFDSVRGGPSNELYPNTTAAESTGTGALTSLNSNGFTLGNNGDLVRYNSNGNAYVAWQWKANAGTNTTNTAGSITTTTSVNASAGFSVITYAGSNSSPNTIGHGLGVAPKLWIIKNRTSGSGNWVVNYIYTDNGVKYAFLNTTAAGSAQGSPWSTLPTSTVITLGGNDTNTCQSGSNYVCYAWTEIAGFSKIGYYTGNANASGPFIYCGFQPKFIMFKRTDAIENWGIWTPLAGGNGIGSSNNFYLLPNSSGAQDTTQIIDILSNGFKVRDSGTFDNANNGTYLYMAFASNPFKNSNAF